MKKHAACSLTFAMIPDPIPLSYALAEDSLRDESAGDRDRGVYKPATRKIPTIT